MVTTLNKTFFMLGKYDTYKESTPFGSCIVGGRTTQGKYDTYKGSTPYIAVKVIWNFLRGI